MRPYLAVLSDAFREARHSRVLWILLGLILLVLLLLVPLRVEYPATSQVSRSDIDNLSDFAQALVSAQELDAGDPKRTIWERLKEATQKDLASIAKIEAAEDRNRSKEFRAGQALVRDLNEIVEDPDAFSKVETMALPPEGQRLVGEATQPQQKKRLNRIAIEASYPGQLKQRGGQSTQVRYLIWPIGDQIPFGRTQVEEAIEFILAQFTNFFLGFIGVFVGILVTASIIPNTFDVGSVNLLLSKPISRAMLYLTKVLGGCWFVLLNCLLLVAGVYLIAGFRLGVWNHRLLYAVPLFLFSFLIYYSVSGLAGLIWRNTIVAVVVTAVFWLLCTIVGQARQSIRGLALDPKTIATIYGADMQNGEALFGVSNSGRIQRWESEPSIWREVRDESSNDMTPEFARESNLVGPIWDTAAEQLLVIEPSWRNGKLLMASAHTEWKLEESGSAPAHARALMHGNNGELFVLHRGGFSRWRGEPDRPGITMLGFSVPLGEADGFESLGPMKIRLSEGGFGCIHATQALALLVDEGELALYELKADGFVEKKRKELGESERSYLMTAAGQHALVADGEGGLQLIALDTLERSKEWRPRWKTPARHICATDDGRYWAAVFHDRHVWLWDEQEKRDLSSNVPSQGDVSAVAFGDSNHLVIADHIHRIRSVELDSGRHLDIAEPALTTLERVYFFVVNPLYKVFPRPGQLGETNTYLMTEEVAIPVSSENRDLRRPRATIDPWSPVISSGVFTALMLVLGCIYISRRDF